ncbi:hypothetical protein ACMBCN_03225, partial [Candidatus Liberibacter asiaticus]|nr:hypothetical protein [Candidatus Liberibacter asiaticus]
LKIQEANKDQRSSFWEWKHHPSQLWYLNIGSLLLLDIFSYSSLFRMLIGYYLSMNMNLNMSS